MTFGIQDFDCWEADEIPHQWGVRCVDQPSFRTAFSVHHFLNVGSVVNNSGYDLSIYSSLFLLEMCVSATWDHSWIQPIQHGADGYSRRIRYRALWCSLSFVQNLCHFGRKICQNGISVSVLLAPLSMRDHSSIPNCLGLKIMVGYHFSKERYLYSVLLGHL